MRDFRQIRALSSEGVRDPVAATQQLQRTSLHMKQIPEWDGPTAVREAYMSSVIVYSCVRTRAYAFSGCPLRAVLPGQDVADHDPNAPLAKLLGPAPGGPNPGLSARRLWGNAITNRIVTGKFAWELEMPLNADARKDNWIPVRIWPLVASGFDAVPTDGGIDLFAYFLYGKPGDKKRLEPSQVFYSFTPSLTDIRQAMSPLQAARYDVTADVLQAIYDVAFLKNDARPSGIIVHDAFELDEDRRAFEQQFDARHRGAQNSNQVAFAESSGGAGPQGAVSWVPTGITQRDAQMLAVHNDKADRICMALSVPKSLLDAHGRTFTNAGQEERNFWLDTMLPDFGDIEDEINLKLAPRLGPHVAKFDFRHVESLKAPAKFTSIGLGDAVDRKIITPLEARTEAGYGNDPIEVDDEEAGIGASLLEKAQAVTALAGAGWDAATIAKIVGIDPPQQQIKVTDVTQPALLNAPPAAPDDSDSPDESTTWALALSSARAAAAEQSRRDAREAIWREADAQATANEAAWIRGFQRLFGRQRAATLKRLEQRGPRWARIAEQRASDKPYGDVPYADPGYQKDGKKRYPIDTEAHAKAAWSYINQSDNASAYSADELAKIKAKIKAALKHFGVDVSDRDAPSEEWRALAEPEVKVEDIFDPEFWQEQSVGDLTGLYETMVASSGARVAGHVRSQFNLDDQRLVKQIDYRVSKLAEVTTKATYDAIHQVVVDGIAGGKSIPQIASGIEAVFSEADSKRATLIARTEVIQALADGALAAYRQAEAAGALVGYGKVWIGTMDSRECPKCDYLNGEVVPFADDFSNHEQAPPNHPNCRCAIGAEKLAEPGRGLSPVQARELLMAVHRGHVTASQLTA